MIPQKDRENLKALFASGLAGPVQCTFFTQQQSALAAPGVECEYCKETRELLEEVVALTSLVSLDTHDFVTEAALAKTHGVDRIPAIELKGKAKGRVRFFGVPAGYEFSTLVEDLLDVASGQTKLSAATKAQLATLTQPVHLQVFVTPT